MNEQRLQPTEADFKFLHNVLRLIDNRQEQEQVYKLLSNNLNKINFRLASALQHWADDVLPSLKVETQTAIGYLNLIWHFSFYLENFPLGNRKDNIEIAIAGYQIMLIAFSRKDFPYEWAVTCSNLGNVYEKLGGIENITKAIRFCQNAIEELSREEHPYEWACAHKNLGNAYKELGGTEYIVKAIGAHQNALEELPREEHPYDWAGTCLNLGNAYKALGGIENIVKAIGAYQNALEEWSRDKYPQDWASVHQNLGNAYREIGGTENIVKAIGAYQNALEEWSRDKYPHEWASVRINLGLAYQQLGGRDNLTEAIDAYKEVLEEWSRDKYPHEWASTRAKLGLAYQQLGGRDNQTRAIGAYKEALEELSRKEHPHEWAGTYNNLGLVYQQLGGKDNLTEAIGVYKEALEELSREQDSYDWANTHINLGNIYLSLGGEKNLTEAIRIYEQEVLEELTREKHPNKWAITHNNLGLAYQQLGGRDNLTRAIGAYKEALKELPRDKYPHEWASTYNNLGLVYQHLGGRDNLAEAIGVYKEALEENKRDKYPSDWAKIQHNLGNAYSKLGGADNLVKAICAYENALEEWNKEQYPYQHRSTARDLGNLHLKESDWQLAIKAYTSAIEAAEQIRLESMSDDRRQEIMDETIEVYANIVQACVNLGQLETAIEYAERSRCRRLVDLMASNDLYKDGNIPPQVDKYLEKYRSKQQQIDAERQRPTNNDRQLSLVGSGATRSNRASLEAASEIIARLETEKQQLWQQIRSFDKVLSEQIQVEPISFDAIRRLIPDAKTALICCYTTSTKLQIFVVFKNKPVQLHPTNLDYQKLEDFGIDTWLNPYIDWLRWQHKQPTESDNPQAWQEQMPETLAELAGHLRLSTLVQDYLEGIEELIIIPHLYLHSIPFSALPIESSSHKFLGERFRLRILPSVQTLQFCHQRGDISWNDLKKDKFGTVEDADGSLPFSQYEGQQIAQMYEMLEANRLRGKEQATAANYRQLVRDKKVQVLHSSHHASSRLDSPLESQLQLADGNISLGEIMSPGWRVPHLTDVFLSCCETNLGVARLSDEPLTLATGFLCAGARSVVSTLWSVDDLATAIFSIFYYRLRKEGLDRPTALQKAQHKLKNLSGEEIEKNYPDLDEYLTAKDKEAEAKYEEVRKQLEQLPQETPEYQHKAAEKSDWAKVRDNLYDSQERLEEIIEDSQSKPFANPYYWAGFVSQGLR